MPPRPEFSDNDQIRLIEVYNLHSEAVPSFGVMEVVSVSQPENGRLRYNVSKPGLTQQDSTNRHSGPTHLINGHSPIATNSYGYCPAEPDYVVAALAASVSSTDFWLPFGPVDSSWLLTKGQPGWVLVDDFLGNTDRGIVVRSEASWTGDFELTASLSAGSSAAAKIVQLSAGTITYPITGITVYDDLYGVLSGASGDRGEFRWRGGRRVITTLSCS